MAERYAKGELDAKATGVRRRLERYACRRTN
jgi:hypothetical protein